MLRNAMQHLISGIQSYRSVPQDVHRDIYGRIVERGEDFFHPQKFRGIPVFDTQSILKHYQGQLDRLREHVDIGSQRKTPDGRSLYDVLYLDVVTRYIEFCHMIPASEDHHHSHSGGLLLHSIEASIESLRWAKEKNTKITGMVDIDAKVKPVMNYCAWLAALLHDSGKLMRDISVNAVEIIHSSTGRPIKMTQPIVSWHPAKESLIEWARHNNVSSYSVNFIANRTHKRHNIDSSQILQPLLRGHYAMDYLLSTPIKQEVYSDLTKVLSGYNTSDDFLSESVRMGDSASTSRSLGYLYDSRLGTRQASTAQRLYRTIKAASSEWDWNRADGKGWILGGDVFIRWSSSIDHIIKVSVELGFSLPTDVKNVLNIMDSNLITDLFDRKSPNDRIIRFTPGKFSDDDVVEIKDGKRQVKWFDLLKLRGPQIIFAEAPMPFSQPGLVYLPNSESFFVITKDGDVIQHGESENLPENDSASQSDVAKTNQQLGIKSKQDISLNVIPSSSGNVIEKETKEIVIVASESAKGTPSLPQSKVENVGVMPSKSKQDGKALTGITFVNSPVKGNTPDKESHKSGESSLSGGASESSQQKQGRNIQVSAVLKSIQENNITLYQDGKHKLIPVVATTETLSISVKELLSKLEKSGEIEINLSNPAIKTRMHVVDDQKVKCIPLTERASSYFDDQQIELSLQQDEPAPLDIPSIDASISESKDVPAADTTTNAQADTKKPASKKRVTTKSLITPSTALIRDGKVLLRLDKAREVSGLGQANLLALLVARKVLHIEPGQPPQDSIFEVFDCDTSFQAVKLTDKCASQYLGYEDTITLAGELPGDTADETPPKEVPTELDTHFSFLIKGSPESALLRVMANLKLLEFIKPQEDGAYFLDQKVFALKLMGDAISKMKLRNYMRRQGIKLVDGGYLVSSQQLQNIPTSEVKR